jgi:hypothetical protein
MPGFMAAIAGNNLWMDAGVAKIRLQKRILFG